MPIITIEVVYKELPFVLSPKEERLLREVAEEYEDFQIDGLQVYYIAPETIEAYIFENWPTPEQRKELESLDRKLKAHLGENFNAVDFIIEQK